MRLHRVTPPGTFQHVISRFVDRRPRLASERHRAAYLAGAGRAFARTDWRPVAFALMSTHVHWVLLAGRDPSARFIQSAHASFACWLHRHERTLGPVFAARHSTYTVADGRVPRLVAYVHNNPVRAGVVHDPSASSWTSHRILIGVAEAPAWFDPAWALACCGFDATSAGRDAFHDFVRSHANEPRHTWRSEVQTQRVRGLARRADAQAELATGIEMEPGRVIHPVVRPVGAPFARCWPGPVEDAIDAVASRFEIDTDAIRGRGRSPRVIAARRMALLVWTDLLGGTQSVVRRALGISASRASELCASARDGGPAWHEAADQIARILVAGHSADHDLPAAEVASGTE